MEIVSPISAYVIRHGAVNTVKSRICPVPSAITRQHARIMASAIHLRDSACVTLDGSVRIAAEGRIPAPTLVANMENVTLNLESVSVSPYGLQSIAQLQLLAVRTLALGTYFCSQIHARIASIHFERQTRCL